MTTPLFTTIFALKEMQESVARDTLMMVNRVVPLDVARSMLIAVSAYVVLISEAGRPNDFQERVGAMTLAGIYEALSGPLGIPWEKLRRALCGAMDLYQEIQRQEIARFRAKFKVPEDGPAAGGEPRP